MSFGLVVSDVMGTSLSQSGCVVFLFLPEGLFFVRGGEGETTTQGIYMQLSLIAASPLPSLLQTPRPGRRNTGVLKKNK